MKTESQAQAVEAVAAPIVFDIAALTEAVMSAARGHGKVANLFRDAAAPAYGDVGLQLVVAGQLLALRESIQQAKEAYVKYLSSHKRASETAAFKKSVENAVAYGLRAASEAAGCKFKYDQKRACYIVEAAKAANEPTPVSATGKDGAGSGSNSTSTTGADIASANQKAVELSADQKRAALGAAMAALVEEFGLAACMEAVQAEAHAEAEAKAAKEAQAAEKLRQEQDAKMAAEKLQRDTAKVLAEAGLTITPTAMPKGKGRASSRASA